MCQAASGSLALANCWDENLESLLLSLEELALRRPRLRLRLWLLLPPELLLDALQLRLLRPPARPLRCDRR